MTKPSQIADTAQAPEIGVSRRRTAPRLFSPLVLLIFMVPPLTAQTAPSIPGIAVGETILAIETVDQNGHLQTFDSLKGKQGLLLLFSRSADWCPYCKMHLTQLEQAKARFEEKGIRVASITYDSEAILKEFSLRKSITYPMLSDTGSKIIRSFGILNPEGKGFAAGIPYPGIYLIAPDGRVERRFFESQYSDRFTPNEIYAEVFGTVPADIAQSQPLQAPHIAIQLSQSDRTAGAGSRIKLLVKVEPGAHIHLYAPGAERNGYKVIKLELSNSPDYRIEPVQYPPGTLLTFAELKETVPVYSQPTLLTQDVVLAATKEFNNSIGTGRVVRIAGNLLYQACDDHQCFLPVEQPVSWDVRVLPFDRVRSSEALQHKD
jgi:peroxiredoxin